MAIITQEVTQISGAIDKEIDDGAYGLILDNLQKYQYQYPFKSSIRELVSNAVDAVSEREVALNILDGNIRAEDAFVSADPNDPLYRNSRWDPTYYNKDWLSPDHQVYITYTNTPAGQRDLLVVEDFGVGLSHDHGRLAGYFRLGYSSKRLNKFTLGKYGIGAKAPLSTGVPFFTVKNYYNGKYSAFSVYANTVEGILPEKMLINGSVEKGELMIIGTGEKARVYYRYPTTQSNGLRIELEVKKHNWTQVLDAVKSQLMYFPQVVFQTVNTNGVISRIDTTAAILTRNDKFIVSEQNYYQQPHIVIGGMNYGLINWEELEMEKKQGALGLICNQEDLDVTPSREAVAWTDKTKELVNRSMKEVVHLATGLIEKEVTQTDLAEWFNNVTAITSFRGGQMTPTMKILGVLRHLMDNEHLRPRFKLMREKEELFFTLQEVRAAMYVRSVELEGNDKVKRKRIFDLDITKSWWLEGNPSFAKDRSILAIAPGAMIISSVLDKDGYFRNEELRDHASKFVLAHTGDKAFKFLCSYIDDYFRERLPSYEEVEILKEEELKALVQEREEDDKIKEQVAQQSSRDQLLATGDYIGVKPVPSGQAKVSTRWLSQLKTNEVYYGNQADHEILEMAWMISQPGVKSYEKDLDGMNGVRKLNINHTNKSELDPWIISDYNNLHRFGSIMTQGKVTSGFWNSFYPEETPYICMMEVAINNVKHLKGFHHINNFFQRIEGRTITMSRALINWNTARLLNKEMGEYTALLTPNVQQMLPGFHAKLQEIKDYQQRYGGKINSDSGYKLWVDELHTMLDRLTTLQMFMLDNPTDTESIATMVRELGADPSQVNSALAVDADIYRKAKAVREYMNTISLLRWIKWDNDHINDVTEDVQEYLSTKGIRDLTDF